MGRDRDGKGGTAMMATLIEWWHDQERRYLVDRKIEREEKRTYGWGLVERHGLLWKKKVVVMQMDQLGSGGVEVLDVICGRHRGLYGVGWDDIGEEVNLVMVIGSELVYFHYYYYTYKSIMCIPPGYN